jgi:hypothetical protein
VSITSSYEFHKTIESPIRFIRREWRALAFFGGGFVVILLLGVFTVSPAYFYPRIRTDTLLYYLKALAFVETGHTTARAAINIRPFHYQAMPGILRSPLMFAFHDFDSRLRAIQLFNIALVGLTTTLYAYILSWALPRKWHWLGIGFAFGFALLSPEWVANVFEMLADAPYAFFSILCVIMIGRILTSSDSIRGHAFAIACALVFFVIAFLTRFTAPVIIVYALVLAAGRTREHGVSRRTAVVAGIGVVVVVGILVGMNWETISSRYLSDMSGYLQKVNKPGMLINLFAIALPSQIIPDLSLGLSQFPLAGKFAVNLGSTPRDVLILTLGVCISCVTLWGMWRSRKQFAPEILYTIAVLPVFALMIQSTSRYLMAYQPFLWIFFYTGVAALMQPVAVRVVRWPRSAFIGLGLLFLTGAGLALLRVKKKMFGDHAASSVSFGETRSYAPEIASTFQSLRAFLETLPRQRSLLIGGRGTYGRWKVISGLDYYIPDSTLSSAVATRDVYVVLECGTYDACSALEKWDSTLRDYLSTRGSFRLDPVFSRAHEHAKAKVYRLLPDH